MGDMLSENLRLRLAHLDMSWEELARQGGETPENVRAWVRRGTPTGTTLTRLARLLSVPEHVLLDPSFNPKDYPAPNHDGGDDDEGQEDRDELDDRDGQTVP